MGLFDKLKNVVSGNQSESDPFSDVVVKNYFEIIQGMWDTFGGSVTKKVTGNEKAKKYVEYFLQSSCDEEKLEQALKLYNMSFEDYTSDKTKIFLRDFRRSLKDSVQYSLDFHEACRIFFNEEILSTKRELEEVFEVIKDNINYKHFSQGIEKIQYGKGIKNIAISDSFCEGNPITKQLVLEYLIDSFSCRIVSQKYRSLYDVYDDIALLTLKALNFEKFNGNADEFEAISEDDYRNFVLSVTHYKRVIDDNPFDKEKYITKFIKAIKSGRVFYTLHATLSNCFNIAPINDYSGDAMCNFVWKSIASICDWQNDNGEDISESKSADDVFGIFCTYLSNPDKYNNWESEESYDDDEEYYEDDEEYYDDDEETENVEVYNIIPDDVRSSLGAIDLDDE